MSQCIHPRHITDLLHFPEWSWQQWAFISPSSLRSHLPTTISHLLVPFTQSYHSKLLSSHSYVCIRSISEIGPYPHAYWRQMNTLCLTASSEAHTRHGDRAAIGSSAADLALPAPVRGPAKGLQSSVQHHVSAPIQFQDWELQRYFYTRRNPAEKGWYNGRVHPKWDLAQDRQRLMIRLSQGPNLSLRDLLKSPCKPPWLESLLSAGNTEIALLPKPDKI